MRVIYPPEGGRIVLGTGSTWEERIEASAVSGGGHVYEFSLISQRRFLYCLSHGRAPSLWTGNLVLMTQPGSRDIYPHFFAGEGGDISPVFRNDSSALGRPHLFRVYRPDWRPPALDPRWLGLV